MRGQLGSLGGQGLALVVEVVAAGLELGGPAGQLGGFDHPGLVEVGQAAALGLRRLGTAVQAGQLGREQLVVGDRDLRRHRSLPAASSSGRASRARTWPETKASSSSARMRRSVQRRSSPPARTGSWWGHR